MKSLRSAWFGMFQRAQDLPVGGSAGRATRAGDAERYPTHARVVLPDGQLMYVRHASLAAAKDMLAAQRSIERRMQAEREASRMRQAEAAEAVAADR